MASIGLTLLGGYCDPPRVSEFSGQRPRRINLNYYGYRIIHAIALCPRACHVCARSCRGSPTNTTDTDHSKLHYDEVYLFETRLDGRINDHLNLIATESKRNFYCPYLHRSQREKNRICFSFPRHCLAACRLTYAAEISRLFSSHRLSIEYCGFHGSEGRLSESDMDK